MRTLTFILSLIFASQAALTQITFDQILEDFENRKSALQLRNNDLWVVDSIYCFSHDSGMTTPSTREYNLVMTDDGQVTERLRQRWDTTQNDWVNDAYVSLTLDDDENVIEILEEVWDSSDWQNSKKTVQTPNDSGQTTEILVQNWNISTNGWRNDNLTEFVYDGNGDNSALRYKTWDTLSNVWVNNFQIFNAFDNSRLAADLFQLWNPDENQFEDANRSFHSYDSNGNKIKINSEIWNQWAMTPDWQRSSQQSFTYNSDNQQIEKLTELWNNVDSIWLKNELIFDTYTSEGFNDSTRTQFWTDTVWTDIFLTAREFDSLGHMTQFEIFLFQNGQWNLLTICDFYWRNLNPTSVKEIRSEIKVRMANPMIPGSPIELEGLDQKGNLQMAIFDNWGKLNFLQKIDNQSVIKTPSELSNGFYTLVIFDENGLVFSKKLVFLK